MEDNLFIDKQHLINMLINNTPIAYIIMDESNRIHYVNDSFLKLRNLEKDKTIGELCYNISNGGKHCQYCSISQAMKSGSKTMLQRKDILPNGNIRYIDDYAIPLYRDSQTGLTYLLEIMVNRSEEMQILQECNGDLEKLVNSLVQILAAKDPYTALHSKNVQRYATKIARQLNLSETEVFHISLAASLHDIGKLKIPLNILNKTSRLNDDEYAVIQSHPEKACDILNGLADIDDICQMVRHHHERLDGKGYPDKLDRKALDLGSKILAVADTYDAMTTDRPYRNALSRETAIEELKRVADSQLDAQIVEAFASIPAEELLIEETAQAKHSLLVRELSKEQIEDVKKDLITNLEDMHENIDSEKMLSIIFEHTPCGYVLTDDTGVIKYANEFVLNLFGYNEEEFINTKSELFNITDKDIKRVDCTRMKRTVPAGDCIFDLYEINITDNSANYKMYVILDRTEEVTMRSRLQQDYIHLIQILQELINEDVESIDMTAHEQLAEIKLQAETVAKKYGF